MDTGRNQGEVAFAEVARARDMFEARLWVGFLDSHGIAARIPNEYTFDMYDGAAAIWDQGVPLHVPVGRADEARRLLAERRAEPDEGNLDSPA